MKTKIFYLFIICNLFYFNLEVSGQVNVSKYESSYVIDPYYLAPQNDIQQISFTLETGAETKKISIKAPLYKDFLVDWGDNSELEGYQGDEDVAVDLEHTYEAGTYTVTITAEEIETLFTFLFVQGCSINSLDLSRAPSLKYLNCAVNNLTTLDLSSNTLIDTLYCFSNKIIELNVNNLTSLKLLHSYGNNLINIDLSTNTELINFSCSMNQMTMLNLEANTALEGLHCSHNNIKMLDLTANDNLIYIDCNSNNIENFDVSTLTELAYLDCSNNEISDLDLTENNKLVHIYCDNNKLNTLEIGENTELEIFNCHHNKLINLDLDGIVESTVLNCYDNAIRLSNLFEASEIINDQPNKCFGTQNLPHETIIRKKEIDLSGEMNLDGSQTIFVINKENTTAEPTDYILDFENETLTFNSLGAYTVTMTNTNIIASNSYPTEVIASYDVICDASLSDLTISEGIFTPVFDPSVFQYTMHISSEISSIIILAETLDEEAVITGVGEKTLRYGENSFDIIISCGDDISATYNITIIRNDVGVMNLSDSNSKIDIFPNPVKDYLNIDLEKYEGDIMIQIFNVYGTIYSEQKVNGGELYKVNLNSFPVGIYFVKMNENIYKINKL